MKHIRHIALAFLVGAVTAFAPVTGSPTAQELAVGKPMLLPVDSAPLTVERDGEEIARFDIEVADDSSERARGLMFRRNLPEDRGMLFVFEQSREVAFWMQNTPRSLDMLFIRADGELRSIARDTVPFSPAAVPSGEPVLYVLEINAGLSERFGLRTGDRIVHPIISGTRD